MLGEGKKQPSVQRNLIHTVNATLHAVRGLGNTSSDQVRAVQFSSVQFTMVSVRSKNWENLLIVALPNARLWEFVDVAIESVPMLGADGVWVGGGGGVAGAGWGVGGKKPNESEKGEHYKNLNT